MTPPTTADPIRRRRFWLMPVLAVLACLALGYVVEHGVADRERASERARTLEKLATIRARLEGALTGNLALVNGLASIVALEPDMDLTRFNAVARELLRQTNQLRTIATARDLVIDKVYPLRGNEAALGLDYRKVPTQRDAALRARDRRTMVIAGPVNLVQGGRGLIGRLPVFTTPPGAAPGSGPFWGLVSTVIDLDSLLRHSGVHAEHRLRVALRGVDGLGERGAVFNGAAELFDRDPVLADVSLPGGSWQLAAIPIGGWSADPSARWLVRSMTVLLAAAIAVLFWLRGLQREERWQARRRLDESRARLEHAVESLSDGFALWDSDSCLVLSNQCFGQLLCGPDGAPRVGAGYDDVLRNAHAAGTLELADNPERFLERHLERRGNGDGSELTLGDGRCIRLTERPTSDGGTVGIYTDVTQLRRVQADIRRRANEDPLTGLSNRARFLEQIDSAVELSRRSRREAALLFIDLDRFKNVNDSLGHDVGDRLLVEAARRIRSCVRSTDTVARLGGDEFTVLLEHLDEGMVPTLIAEKITDRLAERFDIDGYEIHVGASIGITMCPGDGDDAGTLLKNADMAMYRAKGAGRNMIRYFTEEMTEQAQRFVTMESDLRHAVEECQFTLAYQPILALESGAVEGVEALLRWWHPRRGHVSPAEFIPVAEESGLIVEIGLWVLRRACDEVMSATPNGSLPPRLSVNVSGRQFRAGFGRDQVQGILLDTGFPATRLVFEITESTLLDDDERVRVALRDLRACGIGLAVDDFGTGFSSLSYLRRLPVTELEIDRSFVRDMESDPGDARLVETILAMARALDLIAVAEGVDAGQRAMLMTMGCPLAQGFHLGPPVPLANMWPRRVIGSAG